jgi:hypothetical protein
LAIAHRPSPCRFTSSVRRIIISLNPSVRHGRLPSSAISTCAHQYTTDYRHFFEYLTVQVQSSYFCAKQRQLQVHTRTIRPSQAGVQETHPNSIHENGTEIFRIDRFRFLYNEPFFNIKNYQFQLVSQPFSTIFCTL